MRKRFTLGFAIAAGLMGADFDWNLPKGFPRPSFPADNPMSAAKVELGRWTPPPFSTTNWISGSPAPSGFNRYHGTGVWVLADIAFTVFISHAASDTWVARQLSTHVQSCGAITFLDEADVEIGDDFEERILEAARNSDELLVLLTPWSIQRPYIWMEIGAVWGRGKRIIGVLHGMTAKDLVAKDGTPALLKRIDLIDLNNIGFYFGQLKGRIDRVRNNDV